MTPFTRMILLVALLVASIIASGLLARQLYRERALSEVQIQQLVEAVEAAQEQRRRAEAALASLNEKNAATAREAALLAAQLARALAAEPAWAAQPVPETVQRALTHPDPGPQPDRLQHDRHQDGAGDPSNAPPSGMSGAEGPDHDEPRAG